MIWFPEELRWENGIMHAKADFKEFGNLAVPQKYVSPDGYNLGIWLGTVRKNYRNGKLSAERIRQLEGISVVWDSIQQSWLRGYAHAEKYYQEHGGLKTGKDYVCDDEYRIGQWLVHQRQEIKAGRMKADRIEILRKVGFEVCINEKAVCITTPVVLVIDDTETEYRSGSDAAAALGLHNRLEAVDITVRDNKIVIRLELWRSDDPDNYIGKVAISY